MGIGAFQDDGGFGSAVFAFDHQAVVEEASEPGGPAIAFARHLLFAGGHIAFGAGIGDGEILVGLEQQHGHAPVGFQGAVGLLLEVELAAAGGGIAVDVVEVLDLEAQSVAVVHESLV